MTTHDYRLTGPLGERGTLGLIVLQTDETIEQDFRRYFADPATALYVTRIPSGAEVTPESLKAMETELPAAAALLPATLRFDAIGYGCTSGATLIGPDRVHALIASAAPTEAATNPLTAVLAAFQALGARRVGMVSPYIAPVADRLAEALEARGLAVPARLSFGERSEAKVARIDPVSIQAAAEEIAAPGLDVLFLSCTNLRTFDVIDKIEAATGLPVVSSNQALAWHMARLSGAPATPVGRLFGAAT